ncbi:MAG: bifunctional UDP-N-acetylglucosamine diphosphorylase/glucosamine-1-phosphate N-acetyltransferase GlmU [Caldisericaceae bacterium]
MIVSIVLAAGVGKRMYSKTPKILHKIAGREIVKYAMDAVSLHSDLVVSVISENIPSEIFTKSIISYQNLPLGTGDAVKKGLEAVPNVDNDSLIIIVTGDNPLLKSDDVREFIDFHGAKGNDISVLSALADNPAGLGRIIREGNKLVKIVEEVDATDREKQVKEINTGVYIFKKSLLADALNKISNSNSQGEYYLTDVLNVLKDSAKIGVKTLERKLPVYGVNNRYELALASAVIQGEILKKHMIEGVTIDNPQTVQIDFDVKIERDTRILSGSIIEGNTHIGEGCVIGPYARIIDSDIGSESSIQMSVVMNSIVGENCTIGPFSYVRPENLLARNVKIGTFVEVKKSRFNENTKVPHLSYVGDATVGKDVNIGAGTITCNFSGLEGSKKNPTYIEDNVFIGSHTTLVAPIVVRKNAYTAAGSVITEEVPEDSLALGRSKQVNKEGWVKRRKESNDKRST